MLSSTATRVESYTAKDINERIRQRTEKNVERYSKAPARDIEKRIKELDREWDVERALEANASVIAASGLALGAFASRKWLALPLFVLGFLFQHAMQGWCPPVGLLRRLGFRTSREINAEKYALKVLRGDFRRLPRFGVSESRAQRLMKAAGL